MFTLLFQQKPGDVILRESAVAPVSETIIDKSEVGIDVQYLAGEVALEKSVGMPTVGDAHGRRIIILAEEDQAVRGAVQHIVRAPQQIGADVYQHAFDERQIDGFGNVVIEDGA